MAAAQSISFVGNDSQKNRTSSLEGFIIKEIPTYGTAGVPSTSAAKTWRLLALMANATLRLAGSERENALGQRRKTSKYEPWEVKKGETAGISASTGDGRWTLRGWPQLISPWLLPLNPS
jgi:hypothetical protein